MTARVDSEPQTFVFQINDTPVVATGKWRGCEVRALRSALGKSFPDRRDFRIQPRGPRAYHVVEDPRSRMAGLAPLGALTITVVRGPYPADAPVCMTTTNTQTDVATLALKVADLSAAVAEIASLVAAVHTMEKTVKSLIERGHLPAGVISFGALQEALTTSDASMELLKTLNAVMHASAK